MNILFIHANYPAQFHWLAADLGAQGQHDVRFLTARNDAASEPIAGVGVELFSDPAGQVASAGVLHLATDESISRGSVIEAKLVELAAGGFVPRLAVVHGGNGLALLIKQLIPGCAVMGYFEWYFSPDSALLLLGQSDRLSRNQVHLRNLVIGHELVCCDAAVVPTAWQASQFPPALQAKLQVIFDGVDPHLCHPPADPCRLWPLRLEGESGAAEIAANQPLLTYATRGMEPLRGFPEFMRALPAVLAARPELQVVIAGRDRSAYGPPAPSHGGSWKQLLLEELSSFAGWERVSFTGLLTRAAYAQMLQRTNLHVYFSRPYVTSWSLFEAVACGAPILSNPAPTTTGSLPPEQFAGVVELEAGPEAISEAMLAGLRDTSLGVPAPAWLWRGQAQQAWQQLINVVLAQTA